MINSIDLIKWLQNGNGLIVVGSIIAVMGLILLIRAISQLGEKLTRQKQITLKKSNHLKIGRALVQNFIFIIILLSGLIIALLGLSLKTYQTFTKEKLIGVVECLEWDASKKEILIRFSRQQDQQGTTGQTYSLLGDMWEINAHILKWQPKVNLLGIHTGYRLHQVKGIYEQAQDVSQRQHTAYAFHGSRDWLWWALSKTNQRLPLVDAVYGNAVSRPAISGEIYEIYVTTSGLIAKKKMK